MLRIAIVGCLHGSLDELYSTIELIEEESKFKVDLVLVCGDFQAVRNHQDLRSLATNVKYNVIGDFWAYYARLKTAPYLTIFIGGNHECSNYMSELPYGGWVAENIYYMGRSNVINFRGLRIVGLSGIFKERDFGRGYFETPPFNDDTVRSIYHVRNLDVFRLSLLEGQRVDIFMSHDWPTNIYNYGDHEDLKKRKEHFKEDMESGKLGSPVAEYLLSTLKPGYWFAAHMHVQFEAHVKHEDQSETRFLALDKPKADLSHLKVLEFEGGEGELSYDRDWIKILRQTDKLISIDDQINHISKDGLIKVEMPEEDLRIPAYDDVFDWTAPPIFSEIEDDNQNPFEYVPFENPQTLLFTQKFEVRDPLVIRTDKLRLDRLDKNTTKSICENILLKIMSTEGIESEDLEKIDDYRDQSQS